MRQHATIKLANYKVISNFIYLLHQITSSFFKIQIIIHLNISNKLYRQINEMNFH